MRHKAEGDGILVEEILVAIKNGGKKWLSLCLLLLLHHSLHKINILTILKTISGFILVDDILYTL